MKKRLLALICIIVCLFGCGCSESNRDYVAEQIIQWNEEGKIPTDAFAFAWFECKGWQRYDSIIKLPLNIDRDSIITDMDMETLHSSNDVIAEGVSFNGASQYTYFLCDVQDGIIMIVSYFVANFAANYGREKYKELTLTYEIIGEAKPYIKDFILNYTVAPFIIGGHAYGDVQEKYDRQCYRGDHTWD